MHDNLKWPWVRPMDNSGAHRALQAEGETVSHRITEREKKAGLRKETGFCAENRVNNLRKTVNL